MKLLFVTNDISFYGASRSLKTLLNALLENNPDIHVELIVPKRLTSKNDFSKLADWFGVPAAHIHEFALPFYNNYKGNRKSIFHALFNAKFYLNKKRIYKFLEEGKFDLIHLNSITLINLANKDFNMLLHVREILENVTDKVFLEKKSGCLKKMIFIDQATKDAFNNLKIPVSTILNNPFSMSEVAKAHEDERYRVLKNVIGNRVCIASIGKITADKGADFLVKTFSDFEENIVLIIAGGGVKSYVDDLKQKAGNNIIFIDESPDVNHIYAVADYVIRGEGYHCIGRTVYEALYSGIGAILPGELFYYQTTMNDFDKFENRIFSYEPRNVKSLKTLLNTLKKIPEDNRQFLTNTTEYVKAFLDFSL